MLAYVPSLSSHLRRHRARDAGWEGSARERSLGVTIQYMSLQTANPTTAKQTPVTP